MPTYKDQPCVDCGQLIYKRVRMDRPTLCSPCALKRTEEAVLAIHHKKGTKYENWIAGMRKAADKAEQRRTG